MRVGRGERGVRGEDTLFRIWARRDTLLGRRETNRLEARMGMFEEELTPVVPADNIPPKHGEGLFLPMRFIGLDRGAVDRASLRERKRGYLLLGSGGQVDGQSGSSIIPHNARSFGPLPIFRVNDHDFGITLHK